MSTLKPRAISNEQLATELYAQGVHFVGMAQRHAELTGDAINWLGTYEPRRATLTQVFTP